MKMPPHYRPEAVASKDEERFSLTDPYLDTKARALVATDGFRLVAVPVDIDEGEADGYVSRELLQIGRRKAGKGEPVEIQNRIDLLPHRIEWPVENARKFPDWRAVVPSFREGDEGTVTIGLNARLLKGIADALGSEGQLALTVKLDQVGAAPIVVRALRGRKEEVGILMPVRVDPTSGEITSQRPVVDLPMTDSERKKAAKEAGLDPNEPDSMDLPGVPPGPPASAGLAWVVEREGVQAASVPTGVYQVARGERGWSATWAPWKGRGKELASGVTEVEAKGAAFDHNVERLADTLLRASGSGDLARAELKGEATARKKKGRR